MAQRVKCLSAMQETRVQSLGGEDPLEKEMATHSSTIAWKILKEKGKADHLIFLLRNLYAGQEETVRTGHGTTEYVKAVYNHPVYLTYMQSTS